jgi:hypothetical protein
MTGGCRSAILCLVKQEPAVLKGWFSRHRNRVNFALHMVGIPATIAAAPLVIMRQWAWAAGLFLGGYALQFIGHKIEGNQSGEEQLLRRMLRGKGDAA